MAYACYFWDVTVARPPAARRQHTDPTTMAKATGHNRNLSPPKGQPNTADGARNRIGKEPIKTIVRAARMRALASTSDRSETGGRDSARIHQPTFIMKYHANEF
jgi:hypothetical protein